MQLKPLLLLAVLSVVSRTAFADEKIPELAKPVLERYEDSLDKIKEPAVEELNQAKEKYQARLTELIGKAKATGNLNAVLALETEKSGGVAKDGAANKLPNDAVTAKRTLEALIRRVRTEHEKKSRLELKRFLEELIELEKAETKADRIESALAIRTYRERIETSGPTLLDAGTALVPMGRAFAWRFGKEKERLIKEGGGNKASEEAVDQGLAWIAKQQKPDGSWDYEMRYKLATWPEPKTITINATGTILLGFLGAGHTPEIGKYRRTVKTGLKALLSSQKPDGTFPTVEGLDHDNDHVTALCEAYGMTRDMALREPAQRAIDAVLRRQGPTGGWKSPETSREGLFNTAFAINAIRAAKFAGLKVNPEVVQSAKQFLDSVSRDGGRRYVGSPGVEISVQNQGTAILNTYGLMTRLFVEGWPASNEVVDAVAKSILEMAPQGPSVSPDGVTQYVNWYSTVFFFTRGGSDWLDLWNPKTRDLIIGAQIPPGSKNSGAISFRKDGYTTIPGTMHYLSLLEIYYRYPPDKLGPLP